MNDMFDLETLARNSGLSKAQFRSLLKQIRNEFPDDELLLELHVARAIMHEKGLYREQLATQA